jgi:5-methylcytosine-specific restriction endonuclease McrBC regulatory subunit McrC
MSTAELPSQVSITERGQRIIDCPPGIEKQLKKAAFEQTSTNVFVKKRTSASNGNEYKIVEAQLDGDQLTISVEDVVGVTDLTPSSRLQIKPKIGWSEILNMFLTVQKYDRSPDYHGVPIEDFLSENVDIEDIFIVIAVNFLNSLKPLYQHGFIREFDTVRTDAIDAPGRIDIERSLLNLETGIPKQHYVQKVANYNTLTNALIHCAGKHLLQLFQKSTQKHSQDEYYRLFSNLYDAVHNLEQMGIDSSDESVFGFRTVTSGKLPRQREYYKRAIDVSKMILSSTTGQSLESGQEELSMEYIFKMDELFEEFSQIVLEEELNSLNDNPLYKDLANVMVRSKPTLRPYVKSNGAYHKPDHVLYDGSDVIAVMDSKYYKRDTDPGMDRSLRSQIFSYAFILNTGNMAFLTPDGENHRRQLRNQDGEVATVSCSDGFTTERYRSVINSYLQSLLKDDLGESQLVADLEKYEVCLDNISRTSINSVLSTDIFKVGNDRFLFRKIFIHSIKKSEDVRIRYEISKEVQYKIRQDLKKKIDEYTGFDRCIPLFIPETSPHENADTDEDESWDGESLRLYFIKNGEDRNIRKVETVECFPLDWSSNQK